MQKSSLKSKLEQVLEKLTNNLILFGKVVKPNSFYLKSPAIHYEIANIFMDKSLRFINIILPRGIAKSTLTVIYVLYHLFMEDKGKPKFVVIISKTLPHSKSLLSTIKDILDFQKGFREIFGYHGEHTAKMYRDDQIIMDNGDAIVCRGTRQAVRGINNKTQRPTLIIVDDPEDENNTKTTEAMDANFDYILTNVVPSIDPIRGRIIVLGTPLHEKCIVMKLEQMSNWKTFHYGNDIEAGIALWEEQRPLSWLTNERDSLKELGKVRLYYQEYECKLIPGEDALFKKEYIQYYDKNAHIVRVNDETYLQFPSGLFIPVNIYMGVDPASSVRSHADYSTIVPIAVAKGKDIYVLDYFRKRVTPMELAHSIETYYDKYLPRLTIIESVGYQEMLRDYMRTRRFIPGLEIKENPRNEKSMRLEMLQPFFAQHKVFIKDTMKELEDELLMFPKSKHDDLLDGLYYAVKRCKPAVHEQSVEHDKLPEHQQVLVDYYEAEEQDDIPQYFDPFED